MNADINTGLITVTTYADCVTFMSNSIHNNVCSAGTLPKNYICTKEYIKIPLVEKRCENYISIIVNAIEIMEKNK